MTSTKFNVGLNDDRSSSKENKKNTSTSSDSESDEDYVPSSKELKDEENVSEENSDDEDVEQNAVRAGRRTYRRRRKRAKSEEASAEDGRETVEASESASAAQNIDDLWNEFKKDVRDATPKVVKESATCEKGGESGSATRPAAEEPKTKIVTRLFEFAGEAVEVRKEVPADEPASPAKPALKRASSTTPKAGLSSVLNQLGKKSKLSVLEKSQLDWNTFKKEEGIEEDLQKHNKGKHGYLERQDFLQRTDLRQFEIEKSMRNSSRRLK